MFVQVEDTPNPLTLKFLPGRTVMEAGTANFLTADEAAKSPLAEQLFGINGVNGVFYGSDFISVTKTSQSDWNALKTLILERLVNYLTLNEKVSIKANNNNTDPQEQDAIVKEIIELIDTRIRPAVAMDGGDIIFDRFEGGVVYLSMQGACSGCPSSSATLKGGIENMLRYYIPEVTSVEAI